MEATAPTAEQQPTQPQLTKFQALSINSNLLSQFLDLVQRVHVVGPNDAQGLSALQQFLSNMLAGVQRELASETADDKLAKARAKREAKAAKRK